MTSISAATRTVVAGAGHTVAALSAELERLADRLAGTQRSDGAEIEIIRERAFEFLRGLTDQAGVFRKPGIADSYATRRPGRDRLSRYRRTIRAIQEDIDHDPQVWEERIRARDGGDPREARPVYGVNIELHDAPCMCLVDESAIEGVA